MVRTAVRVVKPSRARYGPAMKHTTSVDTELGRLAGRFAFGAGFAAKITDGFETADWERRPSDSGGNTAHWILGHLAMARRYVLRHLGAELAKETWEDLFDIGAKPVSTEHYPRPAELLADLEATSARLLEIIPALDEARCNEDWGKDTFPDGSKSVLGGLYFFQFHESYHLGQLGLLRRIAGKPGFA